MKRKLRLGALLGLLIPLLGAPSSDYLSVKRKLDLIESEKLQPGSRVTLTSRELNAYVVNEAGELGEGIRDPRLQLGDSMATGTALIVVDRQGRNQIAVAPGDRHHVAHRLKPGVLPDRADLALHIGQLSRAGRIDQLMPIDAIEVSRDDLVQGMQHCSRVEQIPDGHIHGRLLSRAFFLQSPTEQGHRTSSVMLEPTD